MDAALVAKTLALFALVLGLLPIIAWVDRKQAALLQGRIGAERAALLGFRAAGLFQPMAEALKLIAKQGVDAVSARPILGRAMTVSAGFFALLGFAVIPVGGTYEFFGGQWSLVVADLEGGTLFAIGTGGIAALALVVGAWASGSRWASLGALRAVGQLMSYQAGLLAALLGALIAFGSLRPTEIVGAQQGTFAPLGFLVLLGWLAEDSAWLSWLRLPSWGIAVQPLGFLVFFTAALAWVGRTPFDSWRSLSDVGGGAWIERGGGHLGLLKLVELAQILMFGGLITTLYLGGWARPWVSDAQLLSLLTRYTGADLAGLLAMLLHISVFLVKLLAVVSLQGIISCVLPRFRADQSMEFGWKIVLPIALANIPLTALGVQMLTRWP